MALALEQERVGGDPVNTNTRFWVQIVGAVFMALLALAQGTGLMTPAIDSPAWIAVLVGAALYMLFEAWRTRRSMSNGADQ